jgi:putative spermidine/putrescine transport system substrate-binding protein
MVDRTEEFDVQNLDVDATCGRLRKALLDTRGLGRRELIAALGRALAGSAALSLLPRIVPTAASAAEQPVTAFVFGGVWKKSAMAAFGEPFTKQTGIPVVYQDPYTFAKLRAMHEAKAMQVDVVSVQGGEMFQAKRMNMIMPLDFNVIDRSVLSQRQLRHGNAIGAHMLSHVICYNKKKWPGEHHPRSWADFWDVEKFPGRRVLRREEVWVTEAALKADGVKDSEFYPLDVARAFRSLDRIKPHVKAWYYDNSQAQQLMEQEEVDLIAMMNGRATESILNAKAPFEMVWNEAICEGGIQGWIAPMGCPNPKGAMKFLDIVGRAEYQAVFARLMYYAPQNPKAFDLLEPDLAKLMPSYPDNEKLAHIINFEWWADNLPMMQRRFQQWLQS